MRIAVNDINKYASVVEDLARIAEVICRFSLVEDIYLQGTSKVIEELERAVVKLYASVLGYLSKAQRYLEQGTISTYMLSTATSVRTNRFLERTINSAVLAETDLGSGLNEIQTAENDVDRCMALVNRVGAY